MGTRKGMAVILALYNTFVYALISALNAHHFDSNCGKIQYLSDSLRMYKITLAMLKYVMPKDLSTKTL